LGKIDQGAENHGCRTDLLRGAHATRIRYHWKPLTADHVVNEAETG
jgi:hypothetical protein